ncbi:MAG: hypothetical protein WBD15_14910, partial [Pseudolabrys sp.]
SKVGRRVVLCPPGRDGIAEYLAAELPKPQGSFDSSTLLNLPESIEQFGRINVCNRARSDVREYVGLKSGENSRAMASNVFSPATFAARFLAFFATPGSMS